ncbi:MAG: hypothetical protein ACMG5Z_03300 [Luteimonas sp.]
MKLNERRAMDAMTMPRVVEPEWLDTLAADDPRAIRSRSDLRRVHRWMGTAPLLGNALDSILIGRGPTTLVELGAGDASLLLRVARRRARHWPKITLQLLDLQPVVEADTLAGFRALGWDVDVMRTDVFEWLAVAHAGPRASDGQPVIFANLFLHHFDGARLATLLDALADLASAFFCIEPRRSPFALSASRLLGLIGCNDVTRHDAVTSVRAGFSARELSTLWPHADTWRLAESTAGPFSHRFHATRVPVQ